MNKHQRIMGLSGVYTKRDVLDQYKSLAKLLHPDKGGSNEAFRDLLEARDVLLADADQDFESPITDEFEKTVILDVSLDSIVNCTNFHTKTFIHRSSRGCDVCNWSGSLDKRKDKEACPHCNGRGYFGERNTTNLNLEMCLHCEGKGTQFVHPCHTCDGKGYIMEDYTYEMNLYKFVVPPDVKISADILGIIDLGTHGTKCFRKGLDLHIEYDVEQLHILLGINPFWEDPITGRQHSTYSLSSPRDGLKIKMTGLGLQKDDERGDLILHIKITPLTPEGIPDYLKEALRKFHEEGESE